MRRLTLTKSTHGRITAELFDGEAPEGVVTETFKDDRQYRRGAKVLGIDRAELMRHVAAFRKGADETLTVELSAPAAFAVAIRSRLSAEVHAAYAGADPLAALASALASPVEDGRELPPDALILWPKEHAGRLCMVDVDLHHVDWDRRPSASAWYALAERVRPRPALAWTTHGRGLRLVYGAAGGLGADELAAVAALWVASAEPTATIELKTVTRHPAQRSPDGRECGPVREMTQDADTAALGSWFMRREADEGEVADWLAARGLEPGRRYPHENCPVRPGEASKGDPVQVGELGVFCHSCEGRGVTFGSRRPGWFPFASLCGSGVSSRVATCIANLTHWEHARYVIAESAGGLGGEVARAAYAAALKVRHPGDRRAETAMFVGENLIRVDRQWATLEGEGYGRNVEGILANLPACQFRGDDGPRPDAEMIARFASPTALDRYGYPDLTPIYGLRIYSHFLDVADSTRVPIVLQTGPLVKEQNAAFRPRYRAEGQREFTEAGAWEVIEEAVPGVNRGAVYLLLAARGCAEGEIGLPPMVFLTGPTSAGKTGHINVAAAIAGDCKRSVPMTRDTDRVRAAIRECREGGSFCAFDEAVKAGKRLGMSAVEVMDFVLNLTADSLSHKLYVGPVPLGQLPVFCWTDTGLPSAVKTSGQLARRLVEVHLPGAVDWVASIRDTIGHIDRLRVAGARWASACDTLVSVVIDRFFRWPRDFASIAAELGFSPLSASVEASEGKETLREFFEAVCLAPDLTGGDAKRWKGRGWKLIEANAESDLVNIWRQLGDSGAALRRCEEIDWALLLGAPAPVTLESRSHGSKVAVRFIRRRGPRDYEVNGELLSAPAAESFGGLDLSAIEGVDL